MKKRARWHGPAWLVLALATLTVAGGLFAISHAKATHKTNAPATTSVEIRPAQGLRVASLELGSMGPSGFQPLSGCAFTSWRPCVRIVLLNGRPNSRLSILMTCGEQVASALSFRVSGESESETLVVELPLLQPLEPGCWTVAIAHGGRAIHRTTVEVAGPTPAQEKAFSDTSTGLCFLYPGTWTLVSERGGALGDYSSDNRPCKELLLLDGDRERARITIKELNDGARKNSLEQVALLELKELAPSPQLRYEGYFSAGPVTGYEIDYSASSTESQQCVLLCFKLDNEVVIARFTYQTSAELEDIRRMVRSLKFCQDARPQPSLTGIRR